eukprot:2060300-Pyramimonas_sp.AAC.1
MVFYTGDVAWIRKSQVMLLSIHLDRIPAAISVVPSLLRRPKQQFPVTLLDIRWRLWRVRRSPRGNRDV